MCPNGNVSKVKVPEKSVSKTIIQIKALTKEEGPNVCWDALKMMTTNFWPTDSNIIIKIFVHQLIG